MNIGFISYWGYGRGRAYVTLNWAKMLKDEHNLFLIKQGVNTIADDFNIDNLKITEVPGYDVDPEVFRMWVTTNKLDIVFFNEYNQWFNEGNVLIDICKELGIKVTGTLVLEKWNYNTKYTEYDKLLAHSKTFQRFCRMGKIRHHQYVPFSIDLNEFPKPEKQKHETIRFFHPGGFGGVYDRKNTKLVIDAFKELNDEHTELVITSQKSLSELKLDLPDNIKIIDKNLSRKELIEEYYKSDCTVLPSKWETIGIPILESLAAGVPVIIPDIPPMNEFVQNNNNGFACKFNVNEYKDISVGAAEVKIDSLVKKMKLCLNPLILPILKRHARETIEERFDLEKNKRYMKKFIEDLTNE